MSGHHPWKTLLERTFTPEERAEIAREGAKIAADIDRRQALNAKVTPQTRPLQPQEPRAASSRSSAPVRSGQSS